MAPTSPVRDLDVLRAAWAEDPVLSRLDAVLAEDLEAAHGALVAALCAGPPSWACSPPCAAPHRRPQPGRPPRRGRRPPSTSSCGACTALPAAPGATAPSAAADADSPLHRARKQAKQVRYLLDMFDPLDTGGELAKLRSALKAVQETLGAYQDAQAAVAVLQDAAPRLPGVDAGLLLALGRRSAELDSGRRHRGQPVRRRLRPGGQAPAPGGGRPRAPRPRHPRPDRPGPSRAVTVVAVYNSKGGVGKTATTVNLGYLAARHGLPHAGLGPRPPGRRHVLLPGQAPAQGRRPGADHPTQPHRRPHPGHRLRAARRAAVRPSSCATSTSPSTPPSTAPAACGGSSTSCATRTTS